MNFDLMLQSVMSWLAEILAVEFVSPEQQLVDLESFDSLALEELLTIAEDELGIYVPEDAISEARLGTPARIARTLLEFWSKSDRVGGAS